MERMRALAEETRNEALEGLPSGQREILIDMLTHVRANMSERSFPPRAIEESGDEPSDHAPR
jgi:hypothetical protein